MTEVNICESVVREYIPGWGESKIELLDKASLDIADVEALLQTLNKELEPMFRTDCPRLVEMALDKLRTAHERIDMCHNELDVEREFDPYETDISEILKRISAT